MRAPALLLALSLTAASAAQAQGPNAPPPKRRPPPPAAAPSAALSTPLSASGPTAPPPQGRFAGLAGLPASGDAGGSCRSICARTRYACEQQGDSCAAPWAACLKGCSVAVASRPSALTSLAPPR